MAETTAVRLLVFRIGAVACAAEAEHVREILSVRTTIRIPGAAAAVAGLVNVRGTLITVLDGHRLLAQTNGHGGADVAGDESLLLLAVRGRTVGVTVDEVLDLLNLSSDGLEARQALPGVDPRVVRAVGRRGQQPFVLLDTDALIAPILFS
jgi:purine-binding chemotaxis protein CheW